jgi:hypothetical protein
MLRTKVAFVAEFRCVHKKGIRKLDGERGGGGEGGKGGCVGGGRLKRARRPLNHHNPMVIAAMITQRFHPYLLNSKFFCLSALLLPNLGVLRGRQRGVSNVRLSLKALAQGHLCLSKCWENRLLNPPAQWYPLK